MTVVVCFNLGLTGSVMVADSRLSHRGPNGQIHTVRDVCQKIFPPTDWSLMGIAGDLCLGNALGEAMFDRLRATPWGEDIWLDHDDEVRDFVHAVVRAHTSVTAGHEACVAEGAALLLTWIGLVSFNRADGTLDHQEPGTKAMAIMSTGDVERQKLEQLVIGDGGIIRPSLTLERAIDVANAPDGTQKLLFGLLWTRLLVEHHRVKSVGGLFQAARLDRRGGTTMIPYFYWADISRRFGTYVAMRLKDGRWIQEHRPSGTSVVVRRPSEILSEDGSWPIGKHEPFEPRTFPLYSHSKGVYRTPPMHLLYAVYDPADVPPAVRASWGDEPLEPQTFDKRAATSAATSDQDAATTPTGIARTASCE